MKRIDATNVEFFERNPGCHVKYDLSYYCCDEMLDLVRNDKDTITPGNPLFLGKKVLDAKYSNPIDQLIDWMFAVGDAPALDLLNCYIVAGEDGYDD